MKFSTIFDLKEKRSELQRMKALQETKKLSVVLAEQFPYETAYLFGSVVKKGRFTRHSENLSSQTYRFSFSSPFSPV